MRRRVVKVAFLCLAATILLIAVPATDDSSDVMASEPPSYLYPYYPSHVTQEYGVSKVTTLLEKCTWFYSHYDRGTFDCSEMSALLEALLEVHGLHASIACGPAPFKSGSRHAWLIVETLPGIYVPVEAAVPRIVGPSDTYFDAYFEYDRLYETIYDALEYRASEFDWWNSIGDVGS